MFERLRLRANRGICAKKSQGQWTTTSWSRTPTAPTLAAQSVWKWHAEFRSLSINTWTHPQLSFKASTATNSHTTPRYTGWSGPTTVLSIALLDRRNALRRLSFRFSRCVVYWSFSTLSNFSSLRLSTTTYTCGSKRRKTSWLPVCLREHN